jgi:hypothetical protein
MQFVWATSRENHSAQIYTYGLSHAWDDDGFEEREPGRDLLGEIEQCV